MSNLRQASQADVRGYAVTHPPGRADLPTHANWNLLVHPAAGSMKVSTAFGTWTVPPHTALWLPRGTPITVTNRSAVAIRSLYFTSTLDALDGPARTLRVARFPSELIRYAVRACPLRNDNEHHAALITVVIDQLRLMPPADLWLPMPTEQRAAEFATAALRNPTETTATLARPIGVAIRTIERLFTAETGMSLGAWRRRARILHSVEQLAAGTSVTRTASDAGYSTPSAYVSAFRRELETTPRTFIQRNTYQSYER